MSEIDRLVTKATGTLLAINPLTVNVAVKTVEYMSELSRRDFLRVVARGTATLLAVSCGVNPNQQATETNEPSDILTPQIDMMFKANPERDLFTTPKLMGEISQISDVPSEETKIKYQSGVEAAMKKEGIDLGDPNINLAAIDAIRLEDSNGVASDHVIVFISAKKDETDTQAARVKSAMYLYVGIDPDLLRFVPPNTPEGSQIGRLFPIAVTEVVDDKITWGIGKPTIEAGRIEMTVPLCQLNTKTGSVLYVEPFSGNTINLDTDEKDEIKGIKKVIAELVPVSEEFKNLLDKFKGTKYSLEPDGSVKYKKEDDTLVTVEGIKINADGSATVSYKSEMMADYAEQYILSYSTFISALTLNDNGFSLKDEDGVAWIFDAESLKLIPEVTKKFDLLKPSITIPLDNVFDGKLDITVANLESKGRSTRPTDEEIPFLKGELTMETHGTISVLELNTEDDATNGNKTKRKPEEMPIQVLAVYKFEDKNRKIAGDIVVERWTTSEGLRYRYVLLPANTSNANFMNSGALYGYNTNKYMPSGAFCKSTKAFQDNAFIWYINPDGYTQLVNDHGNFMTTEMYTLHDNFCKTGILNSTRTPVVFASGTKID